MLHRIEKYKDLKEKKITVNFSSKTFIFNDR